MNIKLAQIEVIDPNQEQQPVIESSPDSRPDPSKGSRVILDEQTQATPKFEEPKTIPVTTYYWMGAVILLIIAFVTASSLYHKSKVPQK